MVKYPIGDECVQKLEKAKNYDAFYFCWARSCPANFREALHFEPVVGDMHRTRVERVASSYQEILLGL